MADFTFKFTDVGTSVFVVKPYTANGPQLPNSTSLYINPISGIHAVSANTPFVLAGKGVPEYGELVQNNIIFLAENFASPTRPQPPLKGMFWYKTTNTVDPLFPSDPSTKGMYLWNSTNWKTVLINGEITTPIDAGGQRIINVGAGINPTDAASIAYVTSNVLSLSGGTLTGSLTINPGSFVIAPEPPTLGTHLTNKLYVDTIDAALQTSINLTYTTLSGQITTLQNTDTVLSGQITTLGNDMIAADLALDARIDAIVAGSTPCLPLSGGTLTGPVTFGDNLTIDPNSSILITPGGVGTISLGNRLVQNVAIPSTNTDATNKQYVDDSITTAINNIVFPPSSGSTDGVTNESIFSPVNAAGYQIVSFTTGKVPGDSTGLANDATVYTATITVDGVVKNIAVTGGSAQTFATLFTEINTDLAGSATCSFTNTGYLKITSSTTGLMSSVLIADVDLFSSLTDYLLITPAISGVNAGTLTLFRTAGLSPVVTRGYISPLVHTHAISELLYDLSREYCQSAILSVFADSATYPNITLNDVIMVMDQLLYSAAQNPRRQIVVAGGVATTYVLNDDMTFEIGTNTLQVFNNGVKQYCDERGTSTITFNQPNIGLKSVIPITPGTYDFDLTWDGTLTTISVTTTPGYRYLDLLNTLYNEVSSLPTSTSGKIDVNFSVLTAGTDPTGLAGATTYAADIIVDGVTKPILVTGAAAGTFTTLVNQINIDLGGSAVAVLDVGNTRIRITSTATGENSSVIIEDASVNPLFSSVNNFTTINGETTGWQPVGILNDQRPDQFIIEFVSSTSGGPGSSMVVSYAAGELFEQIDSCSAPVNTTITTTLGYEEVGVPGTLTKTIKFHAAPTGTLEILVSQ